MQTTRRNIFTTIRTEGAILPADLLQRIAEGDAALNGLTPSAYHLPGNEKLNEAINRSWNRLLGAWSALQTALTKLPEDDPATTVTRERWLLPLFQELGYGRLLTAKPLHIATKSYPISHGWGNVPIHLVGCRIDLDRRTARVAGATQASPHSLLQEVLNRSPEMLWGIVANGEKLRILRDNSSLTRQAYVEFDLQTMLDGEVYADFVLLWLLAHQSRVEGEHPEQCWLEQWSQAAQTQGTRALEALREGVADAITALGRGFLAYPENTALRQKLHSGALSTQDYYRQLLRQVYRLIFLFVAEDRGLLFDPQASPTARECYIRYYSTARLRQLAERRKGSDHVDLWRGLRLVFAKLGEDRGCPELGLPPLGSFLWSFDRSATQPSHSAKTALRSCATPDLDDLDLSNRDLLDAIRALAFTIDRNVRRAVDYKNLGSEELGSVYESLLEYHPTLNVSAGLFTLDVAAGNERKTTGSHYTPTSLIACLLDSALDPVIEEILAPSRQDRQEDQEKAISRRDAKPQRSEEEKQEQKKSLGVLAPLREPKHDFARSRQDRKAEQEAKSLGVFAPWRETSLLNLKICDPACGSGHFLIAAGHRLAKRLATLRTDDDEPAPEAIRAALRDVVGRCLYGVDINPMAVELCKFSLWLEALEPGKPLSFLDHHIQCGNSLLGTTPALLQQGIPDAAFDPIEGDDKKLCQRLKKENKQQRGGQFSLFTRDNQPWNKLGNLAQSMVNLGALADDTIGQVREKQAQYEEVVRSTGYLFGQLWADAWCAAFVWRKDADHSPYLTEEVFRRIEESPYSVSPFIREEIQRLARQYQFFHWHLAFPDVFRVVSEEEYLAPSRQDRKEEQENSRQDAKAQRQEEKLALSRKDRNEEEEQEKSLSALAPLREVSSSQDWVGGFDVVLGNPPWERVKLQEKEWFAPRQPEIANAPNAAQRRKMIDALATDDPAMYQAFLDARRAAEGESQFIRSSERYPLCGRGDVNTYTIFAELNRQVLSGAGRVGCIVPSGIATDDTTKFFFQDLMESRSLVSLYDFENREKLFPAVDSRMKFCLLTLTGLLCPAQQGADFVFFAYTTSDIREQERHYSLTSKQIQNINPNSLTCPTFRNKSDAAITLAVHNRITVFDRQDNNGSTCFWKCEIERGFRQGEDEESLQRLGFNEKKLLFTIDEMEENQQFLPLYEGKTFDSYNHRNASIVISENALFRPRQPIETLLEQLQNSSFSITPYYWVKYEVAQAKFPYKWFVVFKKVTASTNERTMIATILPQCAVNDTVHFFAPKEPTLIHLLPLLCANLNSFILDYLGRQKVGGNAYSMFIVRQLPIIPPQGYYGEVIQFINARVLELTYTAWDLEAFAKDCGYAGPPFRWDDDRRFLLRCELDAAYFHLYGIERDDVDYIMDTFPIVKRKDEAQYGEYRTKRVILEIYDEMADVSRQRAKAQRPEEEQESSRKAAETQRQEEILTPGRQERKEEEKPEKDLSALAPLREPKSLGGFAPLREIQGYQTRLDPPPADPRVAHPPRQLRIGNWQ